MQIMYAYCENDLQSNLLIVPQEMLSVKIGQQFHMDLEQKHSRVLRETKSRLMT